MRAGLRPASWQSLDDAFDARRNSINALRLVLATLVVVSHAKLLATGHMLRVGNGELGDAAVDGFFILSGFLITRSMLRLRSVPRYLWHRALRIMPGFWACLLVTAVLLVPLMYRGERGGWAGFGTTARSAVTYVLANLGLHLEQTDIAGVLGGVPFPGLVNGSLWTLWYEALCYVALAALSIVGVLQRRRLVLAVALGVWALRGLVQIGVLEATQTSVLRFALVFSVGMALQRYAHRVPMAWPLALVAAAITVWSMLPGSDHRQIGILPFGYLLLWLGVRLPLQTVGQRRDLSYGIYLYGFPLTQLLAVIGLQRAGLPAFTIVAVVVTAAFGAASWYAVESRALSWKNWRGRVPATPAPAAAYGDEPARPDQARVGAGAGPTG